MNGISIHKYYLLVDVYHGIRLIPKDERILIIQNAMMTKIEHHFFNKIELNVGRAWKLEI